MATSRDLIDFSLPTKRGITIFGNTITSLRGTTGNTMLSELIFFMKNP
jgi:hypothetical protein